MCYSLLFQEITQGLISFEMQYVVLRQWIIAEAEGLKAALNILSVLDSHAFDFCSECKEFFVDVLVAAVDVIEAGNFRGAFGA